MSDQNSDVLQGMTQCPKCGWWSNAPSEHECPGVYGIPAQGTKWTDCPHCDRRIPAGRSADAPAQGAAERFRYAFLYELRHAQSLDENGYITTRDAAIRAFDIAASALSSSQCQSADDTDEVIVNLIAQRDDALERAEQLAAQVEQLTKDRDHWKRGYFDMKDIASTAISPQDEEKA